MVLNDSTNGGEKRGKKKRGKDRRGQGGQQKASFTPSTAKYKSDS